MRATTCIMMLACLSCGAASRYIRAGASGAANGTSWADAWTTFSAATWTRGNTYYVAGGTYTETASLAAAASGSTWIYVKKANVTDNSGDAGWSAAYATDQAVIAGQLVLLDGWISVDGVTGSGTNGHGIKIYRAATSGHVVDTEGSIGPYVLAHLDVQGAGFGASSNAQDGVYLLNGSGSTAGTIVSNCWIHGTTRNGVTFGGNVGTSWEDFGFLFVGNVVSEIGGCLNPDTHGQGMQISFNLPDRFTITARNLFRNIEGTAMIAFLGGSGASHRDALIVNNVFTRDSTNYNIMSPGVIYSHNTADSASNMVIANNTVYNIGVAAEVEVLAQFAIDTPGASAISMVNNLWENCYFSATNRGATITGTNGYYGNTGAGVPSGTPGQVNGVATTMVDAASGNYSLSAGGFAVGVGANLSSYFTDDFTGSTRVAPWDIGAYEYLGSRATVGTVNAGVLNVAP